MIQNNSHSGEDSIRLCIYGIWAGWTAATRVVTGGAYSVISKGWRCIHSNSGLRHMVGDRDVARRCGRANTERIDRGVSVCISASGRILRLKTYTSLSWWAVESYTTCKNGPYEEESWARGQDYFCYWPIIVIDDVLLISSCRPTVFSSKDGFVSHYIIYMHRVTLLEMASLHH